ncbi:MAG: hypothetical protein IJR45_06015 [Firmicutes bacterium]|nr:hypothetical protein [Bacillota bacterium]
MDKKVYTSPILTITAFVSDDVITASGLKYGGESGKADSGSFGALFGN